MIENLISFSLRNRFLVLLVAAGMMAWGAYSVQTSKIDAIPDLSENQVIVFTEWMGRSPQIIEDQVTYPLVTNLQGLPQVKYVRGSSMFGMSFVYVIFNDETDVYWARERVLERLNYATRLLPAGVTPTLGPDGTGVGHVLWYTLDAPGMDLGEQRAIQDWYVKFALQNVQGVSEIASFGGFQKQYQVTLNPNRLSYFNLSVPEVIQAIRSNNNEAGGRKFEINDIGYIIKTTGYLQSKEEIESIAVKTINTVPIKVRDIATVQMTGEPRLGIFDIDGTGEVVGGIVVMRYGENANEVIGNVKKKMEEVAKGFPQGVKFNIVYDRSELIGQSLEMLVPMRFRAHHPQYRAGFLADSRARPMGAGRDLYGLRKDGSEIPIEIGLNPLRTEQGLFVLSSVVDITERKRFESQLRDQLRERDVLLQEIHHRVKNNLQVISSLINLQLNRMEPGGSYNALQECSLRVLAIAHIHEQLYVSKDFTRVPFSEYAYNLAGVVFRTTGVSPSRVRLELDLKPTSVAVDTAIPCGLILSELITNALKHAFPDDRAGRVRVELGEVDERRLFLSVCDDGVGLPAGFDLARCESLGMQLIQTLAAQVDGELAFTSERGGSHCKLVFPKTA